MTDPVFIAIDAGGTAVKVMAIDLSGREVAQCSAEVETRHLPNGWVERDPELFWSGTLSALHRVTAACGASRIRGLGCTGFGNGIFLVDDAGRGTRPGIVSVDHRAQPIVDDLMASGAAADLVAVTGNRLWGGQTLMQLTHLSRHEPERMAATRWALACKDFIRFRLTETAATDPTDASGGGLMDLAQGGYAARVFAALGIAEVAEKLPPILPAAACAGHVTDAVARATGIPAGTPVATSMMDVAACSLGANALRGGVLTMIAGTWSINGFVAPDLRLDSAPLLNMRLDAGQGFFMAEGSPSSASNLGWYLDRGLNGTVSVEEASAAVDGTPVMARRCHFLPFVFGPAPHSGSFIGLGANDDAATMLRAVFEGVAFQHLSHAMDLAAMTGTALPEVIRLAGGAAKSAVWAQIFADITQRPVEAVLSSEVGALGAAICASVAGGVYRDLPQAAEAMTRVRRRFDPDPAKAAFYAARYEDFQQMKRAMPRLLLNRPDITDRHREKGERE